MAWNQFEADRGSLACGDCGTVVGYRIDTYPGDVAVLCRGCYGKRTAVPIKQAIKTGKADDYLGDH